MMNTILLRGIRFFACRLGIPTCTKGCLCNTSVSTTRMASNFRYLQHFLSALLNSRIVQMEMANTASRSASCPSRVRSCGIKKRGKGCHLIVTPRVPKVR
jgi:hypothetical protein